MNAYDAIKQGADLVGAHVTMEYRDGRTLLGTVVKQMAIGSMRLPTFIVKHFDGSLWPDDGWIAAEKCNVLERTYDNGEDDGNG